MTYLAISVYLSFRPRSRTLPLSKEEVVGDTLCCLPCRESEELGPGKKVSPTLSSSRQSLVANGSFGDWMARDKHLNGSRKILSPGSTVQSAPSYTGACSRLGSSVTNIEALEG